MNRLATLTFLLPLAVACTPEEQLPERVAMTAQAQPCQTIDVFQENQEPYTIAFEIGESSKGQLNLSVDMTLDQESSFLSPHSSDRFSGRFTIALEENDHLKMATDFEETPRSVEEYDPHPFVRGLVNWVRVNTNYKYKLKVLSEEDFEVYGTVSFTIEPRCTFEQVAFVISHKSGELTVKRTQFRGC